MLTVLGVIESTDTVCWLPPVGGGEGDGCLNCSFLCDFERLMLLLLSLAMSTECFIGEGI